MKEVSREKVIARTSLLGIVTNVLVASVKVLIGILASSIAIISEGVNNATDVLSSVITLVGAKLAGKKPDKKHPFGYGRVEYLTSFIIAVVILVTGVELLISSVKLIFEPAELEVSYLSLGIIISAALIKLALGLYTIKKGKSVNSGSLIALGTDSCNDCIMSAVTIVSTLIFLIFHFSVDAYAGIITSLFILKAGFDIIKDNVGDLLGRTGEGELAAEIYKEIRATEGIIEAADMILHNYGPDKFSGSVNVEMDHEKTVGEIYHILHELQLRIMHEKNVVMVFGVYAVDVDHEEVKEIRENVTKFVEERDHVNSFHALYLEPDTRKIFVDLVVDYDLKDWNALRKDFAAYMETLYPDRPLELVIETEYV